MKKVPNIDKNKPHYKLAMGLGWILSTGDIPSHSNFINIAIFLYVERIQNFTSTLDIFWVGTHEHVYRLSVDRCYHY